MTPAAVLSRLRRASDHAILAESSEPLHTPLRWRGAPSYPVTVYGEVIDTDGGVHRTPDYRTPDPMVIRWRAGMDYAAAGGHFSRGSAGTQRGADGVFRTAPADALLDGHWTRNPVAGLLERSARLEPGSTNLIPGNRQRFEGWSAYQGAVPTITQGQTIPGWTEAGAATRIQTTGGTQTLKYFLAVGTRNVGDPESTSVVISNIGQHAVVVGTNQGAPSVQVAPGETTRVVTSMAAAGSQAGRQMRFETMSAAHTIDILAWAPQIELSPYGTLPVIGAPGDTGPTSRDRDAFYFNLPEQVRKPGAAMVIYSRLIMGASLADQPGSPGIWGLAAQAGSTPRMFLQAVPNGVRLYHQNGMNTASSQNLSAGIQKGDLVEAASVIYTNSQGDLAGRLVLRANGGPLLAADLPPIAPAASWSATRLYIGSRGSTPGIYDFQALHVHAGSLSGTDAEMMAYMSAWEDAA